MAPTPRRNTSTLASPDRLPSVVAPRGQRSLQGHSDTDVSASWTQPVRVGFVCSDECPICRSDGNRSRETRRGTGPADFPVLPPAHAQPHPRPSTDAASQLMALQSRLPADQTGRSCYYRIRLSLYRNWGFCTTSSASFVLRSMSLWSMFPEEPPPELRGTKTPRRRERESARGRGRLWKATMPSINIDRKRNH